MGSLLSREAKRGDLGCPSPWLGDLGSGEAVHIGKEALVEMVLPGAVGAEVTGR